MRLTDMADELYAAAADLPGGVRHSRRPRAEDDPKNFRHDGGGPPAGAGHPPRGSGRPGGLGLHRSELTAAGRGAGEGGEAYGPHLRGQPLFF